MSLSLLLFLGGCFFHCDPTAARAVAAGPAWHSTYELGGGEYHNGVYPTAQGGVMDIAGVRWDYATWYTDQDGEWDFWRGLSRDGERVWEGDMASLGSVNGGAVAVEFGDDGGTYHEPAGELDGVPVPLAQRPNLLLLAGAGNHRWILLDGTLLHVAVQDGTFGEWDTTDLVGLLGEDLVTPLGVTGMADGGVSVSWSDGLDVQVTTVGANGAVAGSQRLGAAPVSYWGFGAWGVVRGRDDALWLSSPDGLVSTSGCVVCPTCGDLAVHPGTGAVTAWGVDVDAGIYRLDVEADCTYTQTPVENPPHVGIRLAPGTTAFSGESAWLLSTFDLNNDSAEFQLAEPLCK